MKTTPIIKNEIRPFAREILPVVNELAPVHQAARRSVPEARRRASRCSTNSSTSSPTTRAEQGAASCSSSTGPTTTSTASSAPPTRTGRSGAASLYFNCEILPTPQRRRGSQPDREPARRPAASRPTKAECQSPGHPQGAAAAPRARAARRRRRPSGRSPGCGPAPFGAGAAATRGERHAARRSRRERG